MGRLRGVRERWKAFVGGISAIGGIGYLMLAIMESGKISEAVLAQLDSQIADLPVGASILLVNLPDHTGYTFTFRNTFPSATQVLGHDVEIQAVLDSELNALSPQQRADYVHQLASASGATVIWYRGGRLAPD